MVMKYRFSDSFRVNPHQFRKVEGSLYGGGGFKGSKMMKAKGSVFFKTGR